MLKNDITAPLSSAWASACILVLKLDGTCRSCSDLRKVNSVTKSDLFPLLPIDDCIDQVRLANFVSMFDLLKGYWQVPPSKNAQAVSASVTVSGLYSYRVMPFGLQNACATFQCLMNHVVSRLKGCSIYLDYLVVEEVVKPVSFF